MKTALSGCPIASWALVCLNTRCNPFQTQRWADGMNIDLASALWRALAAICRPAFHLLISLFSPLTPFLSFISFILTLSVCFLLLLCRKLWSESKQSNWCYSIVYAVSQYCKFVRTASLYSNYERLLLRYNIKFLWEPHPTPPPHTPHPNREMW